jgi:hypothetical protein
MVKLVRATLVPAPGDVPKRQTELRQCGERRRLFVKATSFEFFYGGGAAIPCGSRVDEA